MSFLRGSANYVWCTTSVLGKGATGAVFRGVSKHDGEPVAVKTFNQLSHMRPQEVQVREFEVLKKVKHENIVKLLAIEEEQDARGKVIVMELCTGGSLFNILDDPENTYGIAEDEFLLVLEHLAAGMKHLRDKNLIHRDLKPGNIMKFIAEDGRIIYKLTDFGAARELEEDGEFMSLYGTEEYLHPDMYEKAVLRKPVGKTYSAFVDLWSIGVTLFHVATGTLPFRPYGGRKNKEMMYYIVTKKESGVISGSQTTENGDIEWKRELPHSTQLSAGLKIFLTPLLAGLMEVDPRKRWSFEKFFTMVTSLLKKRKLHLFYVNKIQSLRVYIDPEDEKNLINVQLLIMEQTDIPPENQILLHKDSCLSSLSSPELPNTTDQSPLILCHRENNNISIEWDYGTNPKDTALPKFPNFPNLVNVENDAVLAKQCCAIGYSYQRRIDKIVISVKLINHTVNTIVEVIMNQLISAHKDSSQIQNLITSLSQQLRLMTTFYKTTNNFLKFATNVSSTIGIGKTVVENKDKLKVMQGKIDMVGKSVELEQEGFGKLAAHLQSLEQPIKQLYNRFVDNRILITDWEEATHDIKDISLCAITALTHVTKLRESWQHLLRDRATRNLTYNDEQFHILERIKMQEKAKCLSNLINEDCQFVVVRLTELLSDWYKTAQAAFIQTEILVKDMSGVQESVEEFQSNLNNIVDTYESELESTSHGIKNFQDNLISLTSTVTERSIIPPRESQHSNQTSLDTGYGQLTSGSGTIRDRESQSAKDNSNLRKSNSNKASGNYRSNKEYVRTFNRGLKELTHVQEEVWNILKENAELVNQFQTLTLSILTPESTKVGIVGEGLNTLSSFESHSNSKNGSLSSEKSD